MKKLIGVACLSMAMTLPIGFVGPASADSETTTIEKKTTTYPSGNVVIDNESSRTFKLEGHTETYTAPANIDLPSYKGKEVTVYTDDRGNVTRIERKTVTTP